MKNENINPIIGLSVDFQNAFFCTMFCSRGSLEDVLRNDDGLFLDNFFITSFIRDLNRGMTYLHYTERLAHGNLKSSNCLIDNRWIVKISDFGLDSLRSVHMPEFEKSNAKKSTFTMESARSIAKNKIR